jgi:long-chain acyl-CoA synthetase
MESLAAMYREAVKAHARPDRFLAKRGGVWVPVSTSDFDRNVQAAAAGLAAAGLKPGDRAAILSYNRIEWAEADYACQRLGVADVPIYSTLPADQVKFILKDSGAKLLFAENAAQAEKAAGTGIPVVTFDPAPGATPYAEFRKAGAEAPPADPKPDDLATLIYTSGTTGEPKGVRLSHRNLLSNLTGCCSVLGIGPTDSVLSFLPLSHSFERILDYAAFHKGCSIAHAEHVEKVVANLMEVRPTVLGAVPRFYEKIYARIQEAARAMEPRKRRVFDWALRVGGEEAEHRRRGTRPGLFLRLRAWLARKLVHARMAEKVGGRIRLFISGGGALSSEVAEFLGSLGFTVLEGYGLTETAPVLAINAPGASRLGTVGLPLPGVELKIAADGEILARGANVMEGYHNRPEDSAAVLKDGWFHTGDIGEFDAEGYLRITDRKKDLLKTSVGKYVAPAPIENRLKLSPHVHNAIVVGDGRKFAAALIIPAPGATREQLQAAVDAANEGLASHEKVKKFAVLESDFSVEGGELTPTLKVKRRFVEKKHAALVAALYAGADDKS